MKRSVLLAASVCLFVLALGAYIFLALSINNFLTEARVSKESAISADTRAASARSARDFLLKTTEDRNALGSFVLSAHDIAEAIEEIETRARANRLDASVSEIKENVQPWQYHTMVTVSVAAYGTIARLGTFIAALESFPFVSRIESVVLEPVGEDVWRSIVTVELVLHTEP